MMRRVLLLGMMLMVPVLLAVAGTLLSAPSGPPAVDATPVELGPGPDGAPAHGMEPGPALAPGDAASGIEEVPRTQPEAPTAPPVTKPPAAPVPVLPAAPVPVLPAVPVPVPPAQPVPVLPPVVIDDDDDDGDDDGEEDDGGAGEDSDQ